jgi:hypothetical protein
VGARIESQITATGCDGKLGGAITKTDLDTIVIPTIADQLNQTIADDPGCQMMPPMCTGTAETVLGLFDKGIVCGTPTTMDVCPAEAPDCAPDPDGGMNMKCTCATAGTTGCGGSLPGDLGISVAEIQNNSLIKSLLTPDVDLLDASGNFQADPADRDGMEDSLSLGVAFTCVNAVFTAPGEM